MFLQIFTIKKYKIKILTRIKNYYLLKNISFFSLFLNLIIIIKSHSNNFLKF